MTDRLSVHFLEDHDDRYVAVLCARLNPAIKLTVGADLDASPDFHILVGGRFDESHLTASPNLRTVIIPWAGFPVKLRDLMKAYPHITVQTLHYNYIVVAESAVALMLAVSRRIIPADRALRQGNWNPRYEDSPAVMLHGKTALIVGFGSIGRHIATICHAFGMHVIATRRHLGGEPHPFVELHPSEQLNDLLPRAHVVHICTPLTSETENLLDRDRLALLPDHAIIINVARGPVINEEALYREVKSGRLSAGIDVWYTYPQTEAERHHTLPSRFPFHELDNVVLTPHFASNSRESDDTQIEALADTLNEILDGDEPAHRVDPQRGY